MMELSSHARIDPEFLEQECRYEGLEAITFARCEMRPAEDLAGHVNANLVANSRSEGPPDALDWFPRRDTESMKHTWLRKVGAQAVPLTSPQSSELLGDRSQLAPKSRRWEELYPDISLGQSNSSLQYFTAIGAIEMLQQL
jgi:hypothetical protein